MDEYEVNMIVHNFSPSPVRRPESPSSVASYSMSQRMVKSCKNCKYSFRTEFTPNAEYCSKDCETSFCWFMKKAEPATSPLMNRNNNATYPRERLTLTQPVTPPRPPSSSENTPNAPDDMEYRKEQRINGICEDVDAFDSAKLPLRLDLIDRTDTPALTDSDDSSVNSIHGQVIVVGKRPLDKQKSKGKLFNGISQLFKGILQSS